MFFFSRCNASECIINRQNSPTFYFGATFLPLSVFTIESVARNLVIICFRILKWAERLLARLIICMYTYLVCGPFVQLISREISQAPSSLTFSPRNCRGSSIEFRGSTLEGLSTYFWAVLYMIQHAYKYVSSNQFVALLTFFRAENHLHI